MTSPGGSGSYYGYQTDYQKNAQLLHLWHATGGQQDGEPNPLYYSDSKPDLTWTPADTSGSMDATVDKIWVRLVAQDADSAEGAAAAWGGLADALMEVSTALGAATDKIETGDGETAWSSDAARAFFARGPGATMKSLKDWHDAAKANQDAMNKLAGVIREYKEKINTLYDRYLNDLLKVEAWFNSTSPDGSRSMNSLSNATSDNQGDRMILVDLAKALRTGTVDKYPSPGYGRAAEIGITSFNYDAAAQQIQRDMANAYAGYIGTLSTEGRAMRYEGPTNAVSVDNKTLGKILGDYYAPHINLGGMPTTPNVNVNVPNTTALTNTLTNNGNQPSGKPPNVTAPDPGTQPGTGQPPNVTPPDVPPPNVTAPAVMPPVLPGGLPGGLPGAGQIPGISTPGLPPNLAGQGAFAPGKPPGLPGGLLGNGGTSSPNFGLPPGGKPALGKGKGKGLNKNGVFGNGSNLAPGEIEQNGPQSGQPGSPGMPPSMGKPNVKQGKAAPPGFGSHTDAFGGEAPTSTPTAPPVLGRPQQPVVDRPGGRGRLGGDAFGTPGIYTPSGTTPPVLGAPQQPEPASGTGMPGMPPGGSPRRSAQQTPPATAYPPLPIDAEWVTVPVDGAAPPAPPVLDLSTRPVDPERAGGAWNDSLPSVPTQAGATVPVIGRSPAMRAAGAASQSAWHDRRAVEQELGARRRAVPPASAVAPAEPLEAPAVVSDEEAFAVHTPGGSVLGTGHEDRGYEVEPKPTLGAQG
jgi:hypothetical protein